MPDCIRRCRLHLFLLYLSLITRCHISLFFLPVLRPTPIKKLAARSCHPCNLFQLLTSARSLAFISEHNPPCGYRVDRSVSHISEILRDWLFLLPLLSLSLLLPSHFPLSLSVFHIHAHIVTSTSNPCSLWIDS